MIKSKDIWNIYFDNFKIINEKGELFEIKRGIKLFTKNQSVFNQYIDREKYKKFFEK